MNEILNKEKSVSLSQRAYSELREKILNNELRTGRFFLERDLAELLGISRTPLKEALVKLENEGLIHVQPRHGMQVQPLSADAMEEIYQIITSLECEAVNIIASKGLLEHEINQLLIGHNSLHFTFQCYYQVLKLMRSWRKLSRADF